MFLRGVEGFNYTTWVWYSVSIRNPRKMIVKCFQYQKRFLVVLYLGFLNEKKGEYLLLREGIWLWASKGI